ncbi:MAG: hypothetical protein CM1200mP10_04250 [Candidatus Neomarinimicrobiota bacterium]|nr:MAG: hypothetical protein CM1200mP10_04250 [Candidatus Neomarinimicrobiota bacterium]
MKKREGFKELQGGGNTGYDKNDFLFKVRINTSSDLALLQLKLSSTDEISNETYLGLTRDDFDQNPYMRYRASQKDKMDADHEQFSLTAIKKPFENLDITSTLYDNHFHRNWYKLNKVNGHSIGSILSNITVQIQLINYYLLTIVLMIFMILRRIIKYMSPVVFKLS